MSVLRHCTMMKSIGIRRRSFDLRGYFKQNLELNRCWIDFDVIKFFCFNRFTAENKSLLNQYAFRSRTSEKHWNAVGVTGDQTGAHPTCAALQVFCHARKLRQQLFETCGCFYIILLYVCFIYVSEDTSVEEGGNLHT